MLGCGSRAGPPRLTRQSGPWQAGDRRLQIRRGVPPPPPRQSWPPTRRCRGLQRAQGPSASAPQCPATLGLLGPAGRSGGNREARCDRSVTRPRVCTDFCGRDQLEAMRVRNFQLQTVHSVDSAGADEGQRWPLLEKGVWGAVFARCTCASTRGHVGAACEGPTHTHSHTRHMWTEHTDVGCPAGRPAPRGAEQGSGSPRGTGHGGEHCAWPAPPGRAACRV